MVGRMPTQGRKLAAARSTKQRHQMKRAPHPRWDGLPCFTPAWPILDADFLRPLDVEHDRLCRRYRRQAVIELEREAPITSPSLSNGTPIKLRACTASRFEPAKKGDGATLNGRRRRRRRHQGGGRARDRRCGRDCGGQRGREFGAGRLGVSVRGNASSTRPFQPSSSLLHTTWHPSGVFGRLDK
jgi:hypothetical protein